MPGLYASYHFPRRQPRADFTWPPECEEKRMGEELEIDWANLDRPDSIVCRPGNPGIYAFGQARIDGHTDLPGPTPDLISQAGVGPDSSDPRYDPDWVWVQGEFVDDAGTCDEFKANLPTTGLPQEDPPVPSNIYDYVFRYSTNGGQTWTYADLDGPIPLGSLPPHPGCIAVDDSMLEVHMDTTVPVSREVPSQ
jgi:hypothetical protein